MGLTLAQCLAEEGAQVTVVLGPVSQITASRAKIISVQSAVEMAAAVEKLLPRQDAFIATAAVSDYRFQKYSNQKIKKEGSDRLKITLVKNPDILKNAGEWKRSHKKGRPILIGYALETQQLKQNAQRKLEEKNCDLIIGNSPLSLASASIQGLWIERNKSVVPFSKITKKQLSSRISQWLNKKFNSSKTH